MAEAPRKRTFKKFTYRGVELDKLLDLSTEQLMEYLPARMCRKLQRGIGRAPITLMKKLRKAKRDCPYGEKPTPVRTHLRTMLILPEMIGSVAGVYNGKHFINVEIKPEMVGQYLGEFSLTYCPISHSRPGVGGSANRFVPLR